MRLLKIESLGSVKTVPWVDKDFIMFHANFQLLVDFVEQENGLKIPSYKVYKEIVDTLQELYDWWKSPEEKDVSSDESQEKLETLIKHRRFLWV